MFTFLCVKYTKLASELDKYTTLNSLSYTSLSHHNCRSKFDNSSFFSTKQRVQYFLEISRNHHGLALCNFRMNIYCLSDATFMILLKRN